MFHTFVLLFSFFLPFFFFPTPVHAWEGVVVTVVDGDTLHVAPQNALYPEQITLGIRLYGIDAPEMGKPGGSESKAALQGMVAPGQLVEIITMESDRNDRVVALVLLDGLLLNLEQIRQGQAKVSEKYCRARFCRNWKKEEAMAGTRAGL